MKRSRDEEIIAEVEHAFKRHCSMRRAPDEPSDNKRKRDDDDAPVYKRLKRKHRANDEELRQCILGLVGIVRKRQKSEQVLLAQLAGAREQARQLSARNEAQGRHIQHLQDTLTMRCHKEPWQGTEFKIHEVY